MYRYDLCRVLRCVIATQTKHQIDRCQFRACGHVRNAGDLDITGGNIRQQAVFFAIEMVMWLGIGIKIGPAGINHDFIQKALHP